MACRSPPARLPAIPECASVEATEFAGSAVVKPAWQSTVTELNAFWAESRNLAAIYDERQAAIGLAYRSTKVLLNHSDADVLREVEAYLKLRREMIDDWYVQYNQPLEEANFKVQALREKFAVLVKGATDAASLIDVSLLSDVDRNHAMSEINISKRELLDEMRRISIETPPMYHWASFVQDDIECLRSGIKQSCGYFIRSQSSQPRGNGNRLAEDFRSRAQSVFCRPVTSNSMADFGLPAKSGTRHESLSHAGGTVKRINQGQMPIIPAQKIALGGEPGGMSSGRAGEFIVVFPDSHCVRIFNANGVLLCCFGKAKEMLYPNAVAYSPILDRIIITERAPCHQVQIYTYEGRFLSKFGHDVLLYPKAVAVDAKNRIIVLENRRMRLSIFDADNQLITSLKREELEFPNGVAATHEKIYISDNRGHCVRVYNYFCDHLTNIQSGGLAFPIGISISWLGDLFIGKNHKSFSVAVLTQEGEPLARMESFKQHFDCVGMAILGENLLATASKDGKAYVYGF